MEQPDRLLNENDAKLFTRVEHCLVHLRAGRRSNILDARASSAINVVREGKLNLREFVKTLDRKIWSFGTTGGFWVTTKT